MMNPDELAQTILNGVRALRDALNNREREIEVLTQERDNALLRIEELERLCEESAWAYQAATQRRPEEM